MENILNSSSFQNLLNFVLGIVEAVAAGLVIELIKGRDRSKTNVKKLLRYISVGILSIVFIVILALVLSNLLSWPFSSLFFDITHDSVEAYNTGNYYDKLAEKDKTKLQDAFNWYKKAADAGNYDAYAVLGDYIYFEKIPEGTLEEALTYYLKAADHGVIKGKVGEARFYYNNKLTYNNDYKKAYQILSEIVPCDDAEANLMLGKCYFLQFKQCGINKDINKALSYFMSATNTEDGEAYYYLALINLDAEYKYASEKKYREYLEKAKSLNYIDAILDYALNLEKGIHGYSKDLSQAYSLYGQVAEKGNDVGRINQYGLIITYNFHVDNITKEDALNNLIQLAKDKNNTFATEWLIYLYYNGANIERNYDLAYMYAAQNIIHFKECPYSLNHLSIMKEYGYGSSPQNSADAYTLLKIASYYDANSYPLHSMDSVVDDPQKARMLIVSPYPNAYHVNDECLMLGICDVGLTRLDYELYDSDNTLCYSKSEQIQSCLFSQRFYAPAKEGTYKMRITVTDVNSLRTTQEFTLEVK